MFSISKANLEKMLLNQSNRELHHRQEKQITRNLYKNEALQSKEYYYNIQSHKKEVENCKKELQKLQIKIDKLNEKLQYFKNPRRSNRISQK